MAISDILTTLTARRDRFRELLAVKSVEVAADASLLQCLDALAEYFGVLPGVSDEFYGERQATDSVTLEVPSDLSVFGIADAEHVELAKVSPIYCYVWGVAEGSEEKVLLSATGQAFTALDAGKRFSVQLNDDTFRGMLHVYWSSNSKAATEEGLWLETLTFDGYHTPRYFTRPSGEGTYTLYLNGEVATLQVYHSGQWLAAPTEGLSGTYAGDYIRTVPSEQTGTAYWSAGDGLNSDEFYYLT